MKKYLKNKIALVTGSSRGFGFAVALKLAQAGADLIITARTTGALEVLSDKILKYGGKVTVVPLDLKNQTHTQLFCKTIYEKFGKIDLFIHSAFLAIPMAPIVTISEQDMTKYFLSNTFLTQRLIKLIHPLLKVQKTSIAVFIQDKTKKNHKKFLGFIMQFRQLQKRLLNHI